MSDKKQRVTGKVKETAGKATGDEGLTREGRDEQEKGNLKAGAKHIKEGIKKSV